VGGRIAFAGGRHAFAAKSRADEMVFREVLLEILSGRAYARHGASFFPLTLCQKDAVGAIWLMRQYSPIPKRVIVFLELVMLGIRHCASDCVTVIEWW